jgi:predicted Rossmann fold nucleotide-binding protein DprA/Smf involved in DNA uptake
MRVKGIGDDLATTIRQWQTTSDLAGELQRVEDFGAHLVFQEGDEYPEQLHEIYDPPILLYVKVRLLPEDRNSIAMVGARRTTHYGQNSARKLAYQLAGCGITVVSVGAKGIDSASHQAALLPLLVRISISCNPQKMRNFTNASRITARSSLSFRLIGSGTSRASPSATASFLE